MNFNKKAILFSPLLGGVFAGIILSIYASFLIYEELNAQNLFSIISWIKNAIFVSPIIMFITIFLSYLFFYPCFFIKEFIKNKLLWSEKKGWFIMFVLGSLIALAIILFSAESGIGKAFAIYLACSFGLMFNDSMFSVLSEKLTVKDKG